MGEEKHLVSKRFENLDVTIYGTHEEPLFKADDIGELLGMKNIRESIKDYTEKQRRVVSLTDAIGRQQETTFLTEKDFIEFS